MQCPKKYSCINVCVCASVFTQPLPCLLCLAVKPPWIQVEPKLQGGRKSPTAHGFGTTLYFHLWLENRFYILKSSLKWNNSEMSYYCAWMYLASTTPLYEIPLHNVCDDQLSEKASIFTDELTTQHMFSKLFFFFFGHSIAYHMRSLKQ